MKQFVVIALTALFALTSKASASLDYGVFPFSTVTALVTRDLVSETRLYCMAVGIFFEGGSTAESDEGQQHIARVIHERAKANRGKWGGSDICSVVFYKRNGVCQFSFACLPVRNRTVKPGVAWQKSMAIARAELTGTSSLQERSIRYYMNPPLTSLRNACRFRREFVKVVEAGRHEFFREPTPGELAELSKSEFEECERYAQALQEIQKAKERGRLAAMVKTKKKKKLKFAGR